MARPGTRFSKVTVTFRACKARANFQPCDWRAVYSLILIKSEFSFRQEVSDLYTSPFLDTDELKVALLSREVSGAFEKWAPGKAIPFSYRISLAKSGLTQSVTVVLNLKDLKTFPGK